MTGLNDLGNRKLFRKAVFEVDHPLLDLFSKDLFYGSDHWGSRLSRANNQYAIEPCQIKSGFRPSFHPEHQALPFKMHKTLYRLVRVHSDKTAAEYLSGIGTQGL